MKPKVGLRFPSLTLALSLTACGSFEDDAKLICDVEARVKAEHDLTQVDPSQLTAIYAAHIAENVKTDEGRAVLKAIEDNAADPEALEKALSDAASKAGLSGCAAAKAFRANADKALFTKELDLICGPAEELKDKLRNLANPADRLTDMDAYLDKHIKSPKGKEVLAQLRDKTKSPKDRAAAGTAALKEGYTGLSQCAYGDDVVAAAQAVAEEAYEKGMALANVEEGIKDLKGAKEHLDKACKAGLDKACRQVALVNVLLSGEKK